MLERYRTLFTVLGILIAILALSTIASTLYLLQTGGDMASVTPAVIWVHMARYGVNEPMVLALSSNALAILAAGYWLLHRPRPIYGDARWARSHEIRKARLRDKHGVILGKHNGEYLINGESGHVLVTAPTGSGKGVGLVIPNLLAWKGSVIVMDVKQENFRLSSGFRARYASGGVFMFAPRDKHSHRFNPLDTVRRDTHHKISDISDIANILLPHNPHDHNPMWENEARDLFEALALYVIDSEQAQATLGEMYRMLTADIDIAELMHYILAHEQVDPACRRSFNNFISKAPKERSGVKSHLTSRLKIWKEPTIDAATSASDFRIEEFRKKKTSLYIGFALSDLDAMAPLLNLFCQLAVKVLVRHVPNEDEPHEILMLIDEFPALGRMDSLVKSIAVVREYNIRMMNVIQGLSQLDELYKKEGRDFIMQNSALQVFFATNDETTTRTVSQKLGTMTINTLTRNQTRNLKPFDSGSHAHSVNKREFMLPQEIQRFDRKKAIVIKENTRPVLARKIAYYRDSTFTDRLHTPATIPPLNIAIPPTPAAVRQAISKTRKPSFSDDKEGHIKKKGVLKSELSSSESPV
jgi:type IV secretion system protein VirD4